MLFSKIFAAIFEKYLNGNLDMIDTNYLVFDNRNQTYDYEKNCLQSPKTSV